MAFYYTLDNRKPEDVRTAKGLLRLKAALDDAADGIPRRTLDETLLLATWNIREFESAKYGPRAAEPLHYIAEIISRFDLVAIQEVRDDLSSMEAMRKLLGWNWKLLITDETVDKQGNSERLAFLYDSRKVTFEGFAGQVVLPSVKGAPVRQVARTPYEAAFRAGWFHFTLCTVHIIYGEDNPDSPERVAEIGSVAQFMADRAKSKYAWDRRDDGSNNTILLGDFNIYDPANKTFAALTAPGFVVPQQIQALPANVARNKHYDQIAFLCPDIAENLPTIRAGVFNLYRHVYRSTEDVATAGAADDDEPEYAAVVPGYDGEPTPAARHRRYRDWRTYQMSDHLPLWVELKVDFGEEYLAKKAQPASPGA